MTRQSNLNDGGPAFPAEGPSAGQFESPGLTKRELFAAMAMQGLLANSWQAKDLDSLGDPAEIQMQTTAGAAVAMADALLSELEQRK